MCKTARRFRPAVSSVLGTVTGQITQDEYIDTRKIVERRDGTRVEGEWRVTFFVTCSFEFIFIFSLLGELTDIGRQSTFNFGVNLRKLYVERFVVCCYSYTQMKTDLP